MACDSWLSDYIRHIDIIQFKEPEQKTIKGLWLGRGSHAKFHEHVPPNHKRHHLTWDDVSIDIATARFLYSSRQLSIHKCWEQDHHSWDYPGDPNIWPCFASGDPRESEDTSTNRGAQAQEGQWKDIEHAGKIRLFLDLKAWLPAYLRQVGTWCHRERHQLAQLIDTLLNHHLWLIALGGVQC